MPTTPNSSHREVLPAMEDVQPSPLGNKPSTRRNHSNIGLKDPWDLIFSESDLVPEHLSWEADL